MAGRGLERVAQWIADDIAAGKALANAPLPAWVTAGRGGERRALARRRLLAPRRRVRAALARCRSTRASFFPDPVLGEKLASSGTTIFETEAVRMWHTGDDIAIVSFKSKMHTLGEDVLDGLHRAIDEAERNCAGWYLADARAVLGRRQSRLARAGGAGGSVGRGREVVAQFQQTSQRLKYSLVPTVAAVRGMALGGGCEFMMHCDARRRSARELHRPGRGGRGPAARGRRQQGVRRARGPGRRARAPRAASSIRFRSCARLPADRDGRSVEERARGARARLSQAVRRRDLPIPHELLYVAKAQARALAERGYRPPLPARNIPVAGRTGIATLKMMLVNMRDGGFISRARLRRRLAIARVLCGGEVDAGSLVDENWLLDARAPRVHGAAARTPKTQERIAHTLKTGKPLRN